LLLRVAKKLFGAIKISIHDNPQSAIPIQKGIFIITDIFSIHQINHKWSPIFGRILHPIHSRIRLDKKFVVTNTPKCSFGENPILLVQKSTALRWSADSGKMRSWQCLNYLLIFDGCCGQIGATDERQKCGENIMTIILPQGT
jgi:hypothetical protein